jgi:hypothetical protein
VSADLIDYSRKNFNFWTIFIGMPRGKLKFFLL